VQKQSPIVVLASCALALLVPSVAVAQSGQPGNVPAPVQQAEDDVERVVERFGIGVEGGVGLDPELVVFGGHATFGPLFTPDLGFRPGIEFGIGEVTTTLAINLDFLYRFPGSTTQTRWMGYVGAGPAFGLSHQGFETEDVDNVEVDGVDVEGRNRFDFSDTDFNGGVNFIAGARNQNGVFFEIRATAYGVSNVRLIGGFDF
jgi:hypothetical protein